MLFPVLSVSLVTYPSYGVRTQNAKERKYIGSVGKFWGNASLTVTFRLQSLSFGGVVAQLVKSWNFSALHWEGSPPDS
jgi:hypothetical protein